jgi:hypothetical protein
MLLQNAVVDGEKLEFTIASPFNLVLELADSPNWLQTLENVRINFINKIPLSDPT